MSIQSLSEEQKLALWVRKACEKEMPILSGTLGEIEHVLAKTGYSAADLARVILMDPPLTTRVLRMANSAFYNTSGRPITMVSRAVIILGFDVVRSICASVALVEGFLRGVARGRLLDEVARALHAAVVARQLARLSRDAAPEEIFVLTLLKRIGNMVFWSLGDYEVEALDEALKTSSEGAVRLEIEIIGFPLRKLSDTLAGIWNLPTQVDASLAKDDPRKTYGDLGWAVAMEAIKGWSSLGLRRAVRDVAWKLAIDETEAMLKMKECSQDALDYALALGAKDVAMRIPTGKEQAGNATLDEDPSSMGEENKEMELHALQDIASNLVECLDVNSILHMVLEGIHRGVGMDRTALALVDPKSGELRCKLALGKDRHPFMEKFSFPLQNSRPHALMDLVEHCGSHLFDPAVKDSQGTFAHPVYELFQDSPFLAQTVSVNGRAFGVFLADRHTSCRPIDRDTCDNFQLLGRQADIAITLASGSHPPAV